jgi:hypothetical protein
MSKYSSNFPNNNNNHISPKTIIIQPVGAEDKKKRRRNSSPVLNNYSRTANASINIPANTINNRNRRMSNPDTSIEKTESQHIHNINANRDKLNNDMNKTISTPNPEYSQFGMFPRVPRIVAIGDLHGDLIVTLHALKLGGIIEDHIFPYNIDKVKWIGGNTWVVQLGDQIDRCRPDNWVNDCIDDFTDVYEDEGSDNIIINLFNKLDNQAQRCGGRIIGLLGNHELMNVDGDFRYVSPQEFLEYVPKNERNSQYTNDKKPMGFYHRKKLYQRGGSIANYYANKKYSIAQVGSWLFVHGGVGHELASKYSILELNDVVKKWLLNKCSEDDDKIFDEIFRDDDDVSPFWCRLYSEECDDGENTEYNFNKLLEILNKKNRTLMPIKGIVVAHTPQFLYDKYLNSLYDNRLWRIDVGMSRAFGKHCDSGEDKYRQIQVLIINDDNSFEVRKRPFNYRYPCEGAGEIVDHMNMANANFL